MLNRPIGFFRHRLRWGDGGVDVESGQILRVAGDSHYHYLAGFLLKLDDAEMGPETQRLIKGLKEPN